MSHSSSHNYMRDIDALIYCLENPYDFLLYKSIRLVLAFETGLGYRYPLNNTSQTWAVIKTWKGGIGSVPNEKEILEGLKTDERSVTAFTKIIPHFETEDEAFAFLVQRLKSIVATSPPDLGRHEIEFLPDPYSDFYEQIYFLEKHSNFVLSEPKFSHLAAFINGIKFGFDTCGAQVQLYPDLEKFQTWIIEAINARNGTHFKAHWDKIFLYEHGLREDRVFERFFDALREWQAIENEKYRRHPIPGK